MSTIFRGWRRKAGVVTLVMAMLTFALSQRSRFAFDLMEFHPFRGLLFSMDSDNVMIEFECHWGDDTSSRAAFGGDSVFAWYTVGKSGSRYSTPVIPKLRFGFWSEAGKIIVLEAPHPGSELILTLLAAYLILWRRRSRARDPSTQELVTAPERRNV
jgi:hypothetical protein